MSEFESTLIARARRYSEALNRAEEEAPYEADDPLFAVKVPREIYLAWHYRAAEILTEEDPAMNETRLCKAAWDYRNAQSY